MTCKLNIGIKIGGVKLIWFMKSLQEPVEASWSPSTDIKFRNSKTSNCIPHSNKFDGNVWNAFIFLCQFFDQLRIIREIVLHIFAIDNSESLETAFCHYSILTDETGNGTSRIRSSRKSKEINFIARTVI